MINCWSRQDKKLGDNGWNKIGNGKSTENGSGGATSLLGTRTTVNCWQCGNSGCNARDCRRVAIVGEVTSVRVTRPGTRDNGTDIF